MAQVDFVSSWELRSQALPYAATGERFEVLDSWRGISALLVTLFHFPTSALVSQSGFIGGAYLFVDFFFVLSGFVIASSYGGRLETADEVGRFALLRFGRIYPLHLVMLLAFAAFELVRLLVPQFRGSGPEPFTGGFDTSSFFANLFLLQGMGVEDHLTWNAPSWSISSEFFTYLTFALVMFLARGRAWVWILAVAVVAPYLLIGFSTSHMDVTYDFGFIRCLLGFSLGALLSFFRYDSIVLQRLELASGDGRTAWTLLETAVIVMIAAFVSVAGDNNAGIAAPFVFALALYVFAHEGGWVSVLLRSRPLLTLGALSYSIYMVHVFVQARMINVAGLIDRKLHLGLVGEISLRGDSAIGFGPDSPAIGLAAIGMMIAVTLMVSWFTWRFVEMPSQAFFRRLSKRV